MRTTGTAVLTAVLGLLALTPANAFFDTVPPFKGNDTGGIIAYSLYKDGAENWFIEGDTTTRARLVMELSIPRRAFGGDFGVADAPRRRESRRAGARPRR